MDDTPTLDAAAGLTSVASAKGKPHAPRETAAPPKKKQQLTPEERAFQSAKRKGRRDTHDARDEAAAVAALIF